MLLGISFFGVIKPSFIFIFKGSFILKQRYGRSLLSIRCVLVHPYLYTFSESLQIQMKQSRTTGNHWGCVAETMKRKMVKRFKERLCDLVRNPSFLLGIVLRPHSRCHVCCCLKILTLGCPLVDVLYCLISTPK